MECPSEFILSQYADGELSKSETLELEPHWKTCSACGERIAALRAENRLLVESLQAVDQGAFAPEMVRQRRPEFSGMDRLAAASIAMVVLLRIGLSFLEASELPSPLQWMHPLSLSGILGWLVSGLFYIIEEGEGFMTSLVDTAGIAVLGFLILGCTIALTRRAARAKAILALISLLFVFVVPGYSVEIRKAEKGAGGDVSIDANETVDDTLIVAADTVSVSGTITGDLVAFARNVDIQGTVQGNLIGFAQRIDVSGNVGGDIIAFGQSIRTDGQIGRNLWGFAQAVTIGNKVRLNSNAMLFASNVYMNGDVGRDARVYATTLDVRSRIARDLTFGGAALMIHRPSTIGRDLNSMTKSAKEVHIDSGVTIGGKKTLGFFAAQPSKYRTMSFYTQQAFRIGAGFLMGLIMYWIIPRMRRISFSAGKMILASGGIGFLITIAAPAAAILLAITLIGIPVSLLIILLWLLGLYLSKILIAKWIGNLILGTREDGLASILLPLLIGIVIIVIVINLPYIGGILNFLLMMIGLGALATTLYRMRPAPALQE